MAFKFNEAARRDFLGTSEDLTGATVRLVLVASSVALTASSHATLADIGVGERVSTSADLTGKALDTAGVFSSDDVAMPAGTGTVGGAVLVVGDGEAAYCLCALEAGEVQINGQATPQAIDGTSTVLAPSGGWIRG